MPCPKMNPADPEFPHGSASGYKKGCLKSYPCPATPTCRDRHAEQVRKRRANKGKVATHYWAAPVRRHLETFTARGWPLTVLAEAAQVSWKTVDAIMKRTHTVITADTAKKIMRLDRDTLMASSSTVLPACEADWLVGSLMANGHLPEDMANQLGRDVHLLRHLVAGRSRLVRREVYEDLVELHHRLADTRGASDKSRKRAATLGFRTPDAYAEDGTLLDDVDQMDQELAARLAERYDGAWARLESLRLSLRLRVSSTKVADRLGIDRKDVERYRKDAGLLFVSTTSYMPGVDHISELRPGQEERVRQVLAVLDRWEADPTADPWPLVAELGMMTGPRWAHLGQPHKTTLKPATRKAAA